jgi:hypothetical protein
MWHNIGMKTNKARNKAEDPKEIAISDRVRDDEAWAGLTARIPVDVEGLAWASKAIQRKREVKSGLDLLRLVLGYSVCDWSLRLVGAWATLLGLGQLSDVAVRKRLLKTQAWLGQIIGGWLAQRQQPSVLAGLAVRLRLIDASTISQPGSQGTDWRLHAKFDLGSFSLSGIEVTNAQGGETLARHAAAAGEICVVDRGYAHRSGLGTFLAAAAYVVGRINAHNLPLEQADGRPFDLPAWLRSLTDTQPAAAEVHITTPRGRFELRLIAQPLPPAAADKARQRLRRNSRKKGHTPTDLSLVAAGFVLLVTNLPATLWTAAQVLAIYRWRWQVELLFKRLKGILHLDHLRTQDPTLAQVYLLGKVLGLLLLEETTAELTTAGLDWFTDTHRPLSIWRWLSLWTDLLCQAIRGPLSLARYRAVLPRLARYLCDAPRKRRQQGALARNGLQPLTIPLPVLHPVAHVSVSA